MKIFILTESFSFYKRDLFNDISKVHSDTNIICLPSSLDHQRPSNFFVNDKNLKLNFLFSNKKKLICLIEFIHSILKVIKLSLYQKFNKDSHIFLPGWSNFLYFIIVLIADSKRITLICESTINDYKRFFLKDLIKDFIIKYSSNYFVTCPQAFLLISKINKESLILKQKKFFFTKTVGYLNKNVHNEIQEVSKERLRLIFIGRYSFEKSFYNLIFLTRCFPNYDFEMVVTSLPSKKKNILKKIENLTIYESLENFEVIKLIQESDFLILLSTQEPWGFVVQESLAIGTPVLCSIYAGASVLIKDGENGLLVDPYQIDYMIMIFRKLKMYKNQKKYLTKNEYLENVEKNNLSLLECFLKVL